MIARRIAGVFASGGIMGVVRAAARRLVRARSRLLSVLQPLVTGRHGLEVGGPSALFARRGLIPVYPLLARLDNINFANRTLWEGSISDGAPFRYDAQREPGRQYIGEAAVLSAIADASYDVVLSAHMIEHTANPLRALAEWRRVLRPGGLLLLVVPHRDGTFDHRRPVTPLEHLRQDFEAATGEDDLTHLEEILSLHDVGRDPGAVDAATFRARALRNPELRSLHHHVFDARGTLAMVAEAGFIAAEVETMRPYHIIVLAQAPGGDRRLGQLSAEGLARALGRSPFPSDRA